MASSSKDRDDFAPSVKRDLCSRAGSRCSICEVCTIGPRDDPKKPDRGVLNIGEAAHITAAAEGGPRYDPKLSKEERSSITNAIWLCPNCHKEVDGDPSEYPTEKLKKMKEAAEEKAKENVGKNPSAGGSNISIDDDVSIFITSTKEKYQERCIVREKQWPCCHSDKLVRLELVSYSANTQRGMKDKKYTPLAYGDLFKVKSGKKPVRKVLVEGDAGIGKTTLCVAISEGWANEKLFHEQFKLVLLLPLRMEVVASAGSLHKLLQLYHPCEDICDSVAGYLKKTEGKSVLIIADGWDELSESRQQEGSFLHQLLFYQFPLMSVVVTSRPSASALFHHQNLCIDRFAQVRGFSKKHIKQYIQSEFARDQEKAGYLLEQLKCNPLVESVCSVPLNCAIMCHLLRPEYSHSDSTAYSGSDMEDSLYLDSDAESNEGTQPSSAPKLEDPDDGEQNACTPELKPLPTTMTELYTEIIHKFVLRNVHKKDPSILTLPSFDSFPPDLQQQWQLLCKFAFQTLRKDQLVFSQDELQEFFPGSLQEYVDKSFGLLQHTESVGIGISFHFLHRTFQEYLTAWHLAMQPSDEQCKALEFISVDRFEVVWKFFFGINDFGTKSDILQIFDCQQGAVHLDKLFVCHCAFEAQVHEAHKDLINDKVNRYITSSPTIGSIYFNDGHTAHDWTALLYILDMMQLPEDDELTVSIDLHCDIHEKQVKDFIRILDRKKEKLPITALGLQGLTSSSQKELGNAVDRDLLSYLDFFSLNNTVTNDADTITWLTTFLKSLLGHCSSLIELDLSGINLGEAGAKAVSDYVGMARLDSLFLHRTNLGTNGLKTLMMKLKFVDISFLELSDNDIHTTGIRCLADDFCSGKYNLSSLGLSDNPIKLEGVKDIGRILSSDNCQLTQIDLSKCELTTGGGPQNTALPISIDTVEQQLCKMSPNHNSMLENLLLHGNSFKGEGTCILAGLMRLCPNLKELHTHVCNITSGDLEKVCKKLAQTPALYSKLESWTLNNNEIGDDGVEELIKYRPMLFPNLRIKSLHLKGNPVSRAMMERLEEELKSHEQLPATSKSSSAEEPSTPPPLPLSALPTTEYQHYSDQEGGTSDSESSSYGLLPPAKRYKRDTL